MAKVEEMMSELIKKKKEALTVEPTKLVCNKDGTYRARVKAATLKKCK